MQTEHSPFHTPFHISHFEERAAAGARFPGGVSTALCPCTSHVSAWFCCRDGGDGAVQCWRGQVWHGTSLAHFTAK